jgi:hypothetical protein
MYVYCIYIFIEREGRARERGREGGKGSVSSSVLDR